MSNVPEGAQLSDDGNYWWDGNEWQPVQGGGGTPDPGTHDDPTANPGFLGYVSEADTPFEDGSLTQVSSDQVPAEDPNRYCVYAGVKYSFDSVKCMDDHILHTCNMYQESDGVYRASWSRNGNPC